MNLSAKWVPGLKGPGCPLSIGPTSVIPGAQMQLMPVHLAKLSDTATRQAFEASADETELRVTLTLGFRG